MIVRENVLGEETRQRLCALADTYYYARWIVPGLRSASVCTQFNHLRNGFLNLMRWPEPFEVQLTQMGDGDFYNWHRDAQYPVNDEPTTTFVYYLDDCDSFQGGRLLFKTEEVITPRNDMLVIFDGVAVEHRIEPVRAWIDRVPLRRTINGDYKGHVELPGV